MKRINHNFSHANTKIIHNYTNYNKLKIYENLYTTLNPNTVNIKTDTGNINNC